MSNSSYSRPIVFFVSSMKGGGAERVASILCNEWVARGITVTLVITTSQGGESVYFLSPKVKVVVLAENARYQHGLRGKFERIWRMRRLLQAQGPCLSLSFLTDINALNVLINIGLPNVVCISERSEPGRASIPRRIRVLRNLLYRHADGAVAQTYHAKNWFQEYFPAVNVRVISNPVDFPLKSNGEKPMGSVIAKKFVLACGRLIGSKRFNELILAFKNSTLPSQGFHLVILGDGPQKSLLVNLLETHRLKDFVHLPGRQNELNEWYAQARMFCLTSTREGFPNSLLEAITYGVPCISYDIKAGPSELIANKYGILIPTEGCSDSERIKRLTDALDSMSANLTTYEKRAKLYAQTARKIYSKSVIASEWLSFFKSIDT